MKKTKKIILFVIILIIIIFAVIRVYHYSILSKISRTTESLVSSGVPYFVKNTETQPDGKIYIREFYRENNIAVSRTTEQNGDKEEITSFSWNSLDEDLCNSYWASYNKKEDGSEFSSLICVAENKEQLEFDEFTRVGFVNFYSYKIPTLSFETEMSLWEKIRFEISNKFFYPIVSTEEYKGVECYCFKPYSHRKLYVNKETLLTVASEGWGENKDEIYLTEYEYLTKAPEGIYEKPNLEDFDEVSFMDSSKEDIDSRSKLIAEKPISGTNLKAGEQLVENVELADKEELNFLKLTPNKSGIIEFEIYNLETYNKFRQRYSGLRELTEEDFEAYYVSIAYKPRKKLTYLERYDSKEAWKFNFVVNEETTDKGNLLLSVIPNESGNRQADFVKSDEKLKINAETAMNTVNSSLKEIAEYFDFEFETYIGYTNDHLDLLTKEDFVNMDYIKTPIAGKEKVCWILQYRTNHETINYTNVYVDAITGQIIGAINSDI